MNIFCTRIVLLKNSCTPPEDPAVTDAPSYDCAVIWIFVYFMVTKFFNNTRCYAFSIIFVGSENPKESPNWVTFYNILKHYSHLKYISNVTGLHNS